MYFQICENKHIMIAYKRANNYTNYFSTTMITIYKSMNLSFI